MQKAGNRSPDLLIAARVQRTAAQLRQDASETAFDGPISCDRATAFGSLHPRVAPQFFGGERHAAMPASTSRRAAEAAEPVCAGECGLCREKCSKTRHELRKSVRSKFARSTVEDLLIGTRLDQLMSTTGSLM